VEEGVKHFDGSASKSQNRAMTRLKSDSVGLFPQGCRLQTYYGEAILRVPSAFRLSVLGGFAWLTVPSAALRVVENTFLCAFAIHNRCPSSLRSRPRLAGRCRLHSMAQYLPHMAGMVVNARGPLDNCRHARQCPQIGSEAVGLCALTQSLIHLLEMHPVQFRPASCPSCPANPIWLVLPLGLEPSAHALTAEVEFTGDLCL
jgi:hypothetical protein